MSIYHQHHQVCMTLGTVNTAAPLVTISRMGCAPAMTMFTLSASALLGPVCWVDVAGLDVKLFDGVSGNHQ